MGGECDKEMVRKVAANGGGSDYLIDNVDKLKPSVVKALARASGMSIGRCNITMGSDRFEVNQIYQGELYRKVCLIDNNQLADFKVRFEAQKDFNGNPFVREWAFKDFIELGKGTGLLTYAVKEQIAAVESVEERVKLSLKYKVFCDDTALYLDIKNDHKDQAVTGEAAKSLLNFGKIVTLSKHED